MFEIEYPKLKNIKTMLILRLFILEFSSGVSALRAGIYEAFLGLLWHFNTYNLPQTTVVLRT